MRSETYIERRGELETYFDRTAADAWAKLTSDAPVSGIRATVRAGRDEMRNTLLSWLPEDLSGRRVLDAGCGAGQLSLEVAKRGAEVVAIDLSKTLVELAQSRLHAADIKGTIDFRIGDMFDPALGAFDHVVAMDSLIHYPATDIVRVLEGFAPRTSQSIEITFAPKTALLTAMHTAGKLFPRGDKSPAIEPVAGKKLYSLIDGSSSLRGWAPNRTHNVKSGFYFSTALELSTQ